MKGNCGSSLQTNKLGMTQLSDLIPPVLQPKTSLLLVQGRLLLLFFHNAFAIFNQYLYCVTVWVSKVRHRSSPKTTEGSRDHQWFTHWWFFTSSTLREVRGHGQLQVILNYSQSNVSSKSNLKSLGTFASVIFHFYLKKEGISFTILGPGYKWHWSHIAIILNIPVRDDLCATHSVLWLQSTLN